MCCVNIFILDYIGIFSPFYSSITLCTCILQILIFFKVIRLSLCIFKRKIHLLDVTFCYTRNTQNVLKLNKYNCVKTSSMSLKRSKRSVHQMCNSKWIFCFSNFSSGHFSIPCISNYKVNLVVVLHNFCLKAFLKLHFKRIRHKRSKWRVRGYKCLTFSSHTDRILQCIVLFQMYKKQSKQQSRRCTWLYSKGFLKLGSYTRMFIIDISISIDDKE